MDYYGDCFSYPCYTDSNNGGAQNWYSTSYAIDGNDLGYPSSSAYPVFLSPRKEKNDETAYPISTDAWKAVYDASLANFYDPPKLVFSSPPGAASSSSTLDVSSSAIPLVTNPDARSPHLAPNCQDQFLASSSSANGSLPNSPVRSDGPASKLDAPSRHESPFPRLLSPFRNDDSANVIFSHSPSPICYQKTPNSSPWPSPVRPPRARRPLASIGNALQTPCHSPTSHSGLSPLTPLSATRLASSVHGSPSASVASRKRANDELPALVLPPKKRRTYKRAASPTPAPRRNARYHLREKVPAPGAAANSQVKIPFQDSASANDGLDGANTNTPALRFGNPNIEKVASSRRRIADENKRTINSTSAVSQAVVISKRTFPDNVEIVEGFPAFYRKYPISSFLANEDCTAFKENGQTNPGGIWNPPRSALDLYTPRFVRGRGAEKVGLCPICIEPAERGGEGRKLWFGTKVSAFNYHMQYTHGISASTGKPFSPPLATRVVDRPNANIAKGEKERMTEGKCHRCKAWVKIEGVKNVTVKVKEMFWWKHAATCHAGSNIEGEGDIYEEDEVYRAATDGSPAGDCGLPDAHAMPRV